MDLDAIKDRITAAIPDSDVTVTQPRGRHDEDHLGVRVVSPVFREKSLVEQHQLVYDALGELMTREIHAVELQTLTPEDTDS